MPNAQKLVNRKAIRGAAFLRVSTPRQRDKGSSIEAQRSTINAAAARHNATIVEEYGGAEHATPEHEHAEFVRMINDAEAGKFDAIFVAPGDRWSRDTESNEWGVRRLRKHRVRLFIGDNEENLNSGITRASLTIRTKMSEIGTDERLDQSVKCRVENAALGFVTSSLPPYGRNVPAELDGTKRKWVENPDGTAKWTVDESAKRYVEKAARLYLSGKTWAEVGQALGCDENTVRRRVLAAGGQWQQRFRLRDGQNSETFTAVRFYERLSFKDDCVTVTIPIPALLDEVILDRVRAKAAAHYADNKAPNKQALGGYLRCANCGGSIGTHYQAKSGAVYLQHNGPRLPGCPSSFGRYESMERSVLRQYSLLLQNLAELEAAAREALAAEIRRQPELESEFREEKSAYLRLSREHEDICKKIKVLDLAEGGATLRQLGAEAKRLEIQLKAKEERVKELEQQMKVTPLPPDFAERLEFTLFCIRGYGTNSRWLWTWPAAQRRELVKFLFGHPSRKPPKNNKPAEDQTGIHLTRNYDKQTDKPLIEWVAKGLFPQVSDTVWLDPKVTACYRAATTGKGIDRKRLVEMIRRLDIGQFRFAREGYNALKLKGKRWFA